MASNAGTDSKPGTYLRGRARQAGLQRARDWYVKMKPVFDAMDARGEFSDSVRQQWPVAPPC